MSRRERAIAELRNCGTAEFWRGPLLGIMVVWAARRLSLTAYESQLRASMTSAIVAVLVSVLIQAGVGKDQRNARTVETITATEASLLVYLVPHAERIRDAGMDGGLELQTNPKLNQREFYYFWLYNRTLEGPGSLTVGYYAVNKHSATVWDLDEERVVSNARIAGAQRIVLRGHGIGEEEVRQYSDRKPGFGR